MTRLLFRNKHLVQMSTSGRSLFDFPQTSYIVFPLLTFTSYLTPIPILSFLSAPSGFGARVLTPLLSRALIKASDGAPTVENSPQKAIALLTAFYLASVYIGSAVMSVTGQLLGNKVGYKNREPRFNKRNLSGLPHRMVATHEALYDIFPAYAVTAALLAASITAESSAIPINALVLHVFFKLAIFWPSYVMSIDLARSYSHMCSVSALLVALWAIVKERS
ncbi:hypothetical protein DFH07DRAFT_426638 [Mycena maculata]|uniref:MAPEG family protein n=1 Tax=Mycena maculata TaxID=230809 RepID=A0AAD7JAS7_9AGAR|nr:hypothetical protein DFH07DRAFT_426638 [Mycena maculata]